MPFKDHEKKKAYGRIWVAAKRAKNPEPHREANRKYRAANPELKARSARCVQAARPRALIRETPA